MKKNTDKLIDAWLVRSAQTGDAKAFDHLIKRWQPKLVAYSRSQLQDLKLAKEATQDTLLYVSQSLSTLRDAQAFPKWVYQILHRRCADQIRHLQRKRRYEGESNTYEPVHNGETLDLQRAIQRLEPNFADVIRLFYFEGFSAKEMAEILDVPSGTVKSRLFTARKILKDIMENKDD